MNRPFAALLTLTGLLTATEVQAQHLLGRGRVSQPMSYASAPLNTSTMPVASVPRTYSYSYYSRSALPARTYVGYGTNDFAFHGMPYGHPYDPYTWAAMSSSTSSALSRYYDPPVK